MVSFVIEIIATALNVFVIIIKAVAVGIAHVKCLSSPTPATPRRRKMGLEVSLDIGKPLNLRVYFLLALKSSEAHRALIEHWDVNR